MMNILRGLFSRGGRPKPAYFISTASQSKERIKRLGLALPPEGGGGVLDIGRIAMPGGEGVVGDEGVGEGMGDGVGMPVELKPDAFLDWVITISAGERKSFAREDVNEVFDLSWRKQYPEVGLYGLSITDNRWTYVMAGDAPERYSMVQAAVDLINYTGDLAVMQVMVEKRMVTMAGRVTGRLVEPVVEKSAGEAEVRRAALVGLREELRADVVVVLKSDGFYPGMLAWDVLTGTGLHWGDGDLFHWDNPRRGYGDDHLFSVWTSTAPGYFFPEAIKEGRFDPVDLAFGYWIGRSIDPLGVFEVLADELEYCRQRLGGVLLGRDGKPFDVAAERARLVEVVDAMKARGMRPGSHTALRMF